jgi:hypothetical protein
VELLGADHVGLISERDDLTPNIGRFFDRARLQGPDGAHVTPIAATQSPRSMTFTTPLQS